MNLAILVGVIASEIKTQQIRDGSVTRFRLKTVEQYSLDGDVKERSQTHLIDVWNRYLQQNIVPMIRPGQMLEIQGAIESRNMAREGEPARWTTSIVLRNNGIINVLGGPGSNTSVRTDAREDEPQAPAPRQSAPRVDHSPRKPAPVGAAADGLDDDVPF